MIPGIVTQSPGKRFIASKLISVHSPIAASLTRPRQFQKTITMAKGLAASTTHFKTRVLKASTDSLARLARRVNKKITVLQGQFVERSEIYTTHAVHFNGSSYLRRSTGVSGFGGATGVTWSLWTKLSAANDGIFADQACVVQGTTGSGGTNYFSFSWGGNPSFGYLDTTPTGGPGQAITTAGWVGITCSVDLSASPKAMIFAGDVDVQAYSVTGLLTSATLAASTDFYFGQDAFSTFITGDIADFRIWPSFYDISVLANRRNFVGSNGKPVKPALANAILGTPLISFIGDASGFPINGGSGGSFTLTGSLTNASTSPTD